MLYHASQTGGITRLEPRVSDHGVPLLYLSEKRENVLVYLSNAVEKYCRETGFAYAGIWKKWGPYGFDLDGRLRLEEYYPDALQKTYQGVSGYIYEVERVAESGFSLKIPYAVTTREPADVVRAEFVPDAYEEILRAEQEGLIRIMRYQQMPENMRKWLIKVTREEYENSADHPEYRHFLRGVFPEYLPGR